MIWTILGLVLKGLGLADLATRAFEKAAAKKAGMDAQKAADDAATVAAATAAARAGSEVAGESDDQVKADLEKNGDFRP